MDEKVIDNGLDFIVRAAGELWDYKVSEKQQLKYSTVHLYEGIELMLKARLMREHWSLILAMPDAFKGRPLDTGDFVSVNYERAADVLRRSVAPD